MTFREGMSKEELTAELIRTMDAFRPSIAEMARDARRWQFCVEHGFPDNHDGGGHWTEDWQLPLDDIDELARGATPAECIDKAIAMLEQNDATT